MSILSLVERPRVLVAVIAIAAAAAAGSRDPIIAQGVASDEGASPPADERSPSEETPAAGDESPGETANTGAGAAAPEAAETRHDAESASAERAVAPSKPVKQPSAEERAKLAVPDDYYAKRAKELLKQDGAVDSRPSPLAAAYPDKFVVVCEAGCRSRKPVEIVWMAPRPVTKTETQSAMVPASTAAHDENIVCTGGCYGDTTRTHRSRLTSSAAPAAGGQNAGFGDSWTTTVSDARSDADAKARKKKSGSGDWMRQISADQATKGAAQPQPAAPPPPAAHADLPPTPAAPAKADIAEPAAKVVAANVVAESVPAEQAGPMAPAAAPAVESPAVAPSVTAAEADAPAGDPGPQSAPGEAEATEPANTEPALAADPAEHPTPAAQAAAPVATAEAQPSPSAAPGAAAAPETKPGDGPATADVAAAAAAPASAESPAASAVAAPEAPPTDVPAAAPAANDGEASDREATEKAVADNNVAERDASDAGIANAAEKDLGRNGAAGNDAADVAPGVAQAPAGEVKVAALDPAPAEPAEPSVTEPTPPAAAAEPAKPAADEAPQAAAPVMGAPKSLAALFAATDPEMNAAIRKAREQLAEFWTALDDPGDGETAFSLKVAIAGNGAVEQFWLIDIKRENGQLTGTINNEPELVKSVEMGQRYEFTEDRITDWLFKRKGKMVGNETMRPLLRRMAKEEAAPYWAMYEKP